MARIAKRIVKLAEAKKTSRPEACSAMGLIAHGLLQDYLGPDRKVIDMDRFCTALVQTLYDAYAQGWKDCEDVQRNKSSSGPID